MVVPRGLGKRGNRVLLLNGDRVSVWEEEKVLEMEAMVVQQCQALNAIELCN